MKNKFWQLQRFGVSIGEATIVLMIYLFFSWGYYVTLEINSAAFLNDGFDLSFRGYRGQGIDYLIKLAFTLPIWWLVFRVLKSWNLQYRLLVHLITLPLFTYGWQQTYYFLSGYLGYGHLDGDGQVWDLYIPALFYILQFGIFHAYEYYSENQKKQKLEAELREAALKSELSALKAQVNPHFLYNVFNTINASIPKEHEKTRMLIAELSDLFRYQLRASQNDLVPLRDELDFVKKYLHLEKARFKDRLKVHIDVEERLLDRQIPPMILQPLIENSVKHGISSLIEGGSILLKITEGEGKLHFLISDTGVGVKDKTELFGKGVGLTNMNLRLEKMYNGALLITDNQPKGLSISFFI